MSGSAFASMLDSPAARALFEPRAVVQAMLDVEAALSAAQAELGMVSAAHAQVILACCRAEDFDIEDLMEASRTAGSLAIPLVQALTRRVREMGPEATAAVHLGATSQDIIDTAWCLQARQALALLDADLGRVLDAILTLKQRHGHAPMVARTLMQPASIITFGARLLNWFAPLLRSRQHLRQAGDRALQLQLGGAVGTSAAWGDQAQPLARAVALRLGLPQNPWPWQTQRDEFARLCAELGVVCGALGKVAVDVSLMSQAEVGEFFETAGSGRGGSSAMPHKRNPVGSLVVRASLHRAGPRVAAVLGAMAHEQERALGAWQAELAEGAELMTLACGAAQAMVQALEGAKADEQRMLQNIDALKGLPMAESLARHWALKIGRDQAHARVQELSARVAAEGLTLEELAAEVVSQDRLVRDAAHGDEGLALQELQALFDPLNASAAGAQNTESAWQGLMTLHESLK